MNRTEALEYYQKAQKRGRQNYREKTLSGQSPYLPVLDDILQNTNVEQQIPLGVMEVPLHLVVGTKTAGRTAAFASNFMPLLPQDTEFATKWVSLCLAHLEDGIHDPIRCFEYMGLFYVQEGNKRVSVLKSFGADSIAAHVTRIVPRWVDVPVVRQYYEFMEAFPLTGLYTLQFTRPGSYAKLQTLLGKAPGEKWNDDDRADVLSLHNWVEKAYQAHGGAHMKTTADDVLLLLMKLYPLEELKQDTPAGLAKRLDSVWDDVLAMENPAPITVSSAPAAPAAQKTTLLDRVLPKKPQKLKVAFVYERTPETSTWTSQHEFGRTQLDGAFPGQVTTAAYFNAEQGKNDDALMEQAIAEGANMVFTTSPKLVGASLRAAVKHPEVHILNCSMDMPYASIRTYYTRMYEAKFITGAIAGAMAKNDRVGFVADYPNFGVPANINAFALGARMVNPRVRVVLKWTCLPGDPLTEFLQKGITVVSGRDAPHPNRSQREFGTFQVLPGGILRDLASPFWHWGQFYENVVRTVLDGGWSRDKSGTDGRVVNYWWGMNSGVLDVLMSRELPHDVRHLADILRGGLTSGAVDPFACRIVAQDGTLKNEGLHGFEPEQIIHMDWLCDAVEGSIPEYEELIPEARPMYRMQGLHRDRLAAEKEAVL